VTVPPASACSYSPRSGNALRFFVDGEPAFRRICEAIESARHRIWATVTFMWADFRMPDGRGTLLDVLRRAAERGVDVRVVFWRPDSETESWKKNAFWGSPEHFELLDASGSGVCVRWDRAEPGYCQHQKVWIIDAGTEGETAFLGSLNLNPNSMVAPGHNGAGQNHDLILELTGPSAVDVHHNFVQRWNEASERDLPGGRWGPCSETDLAFPTGVPVIQGGATAQIQRTIHKGRWSCGGDGLHVSMGEQSNFEQYLSAIDAAQRWIYIENQSVTVPAIIEALRRALVRGVEVMLLVPAEAPIPMEIEGLGAFNNFTLAGIAGLAEDGERTPVWVHSKVMLIDGEWGTVGSCNLHRFSLFGNCELNAAFWSREAVQELLGALFREHLDVDIRDMDQPLQLCKQIAVKNRARFDAGDPQWQGLIYNLLPPTP
jgi:cardiolipin synthase